MIPHTEPQWQALPWQQELRDAVRNPAELFALLGLKPDAIEERLTAAEDFPLLVPKPFLRRMKTADPTDPLLLQVLPSPAELASPPGYSTDPLEEASKNPVPGLIHKYRGRVLLVAAPGCAINCRYCFRRHFNYSENNPSRAQWQAALDYIAQDSSVSEVILSGGDPLLLSDNRLGELVERIEAIEHVRRLRIHSRLPVVIPSRVTTRLCSILSDTRLQCVMVVHCNHANEIDDELTGAFKTLARAGVTLLNQTVLLARVNDCATRLEELSQALFTAGVMPYYLHLLDQVSGAAHFDIPESRAREIYRQLMASTSGYLVPRLVRESPEKPSKVPLAAYD